jgi:hypothetical protein
MSDDSRDQPDLPQFYGQDPFSNDNMRYRLDGDDVIERAVDTIKGLVGVNEKNEKVYDPTMRLMNDLGIQAVRMTIELGVNKINHLTKYKDEDRINRQLRAVFGAWQFELTKNMKMWAPETKFNAQSGRWVMVEGKKVRNPYLITQKIENAILQATLRGDAGFEAQLTGKAYSVQEVHDRRGEEQDRGRSGGSWWNPFGGRR